MPVATPVTNPALTVAAAELLEVQVAELVTSCVVLSEKVAVAVSCCCEPLITVGFDGERAIELTTLLLTVSVVLCFMLPSVAVMVVLPRATPVAVPVESIVAIEVLEEVQVTVDVISRVLPSPKYPLAENATVPVGFTAGFSGLIVKEERSFGPMKKLSHAAKPSSSKATNIPNLKRENIAVPSTKMGATSSG